jgi:ubiquinone/menaquinone biosynthesis C-methylase UbiE
MVDLLGEAAAVAPGQTVVDAGCGFGDQDLRLMRTRRPERIVAFNVTDVQLEHARVHNAHPGIEYRKGSATALDLVAQSADSVVSLEAAFHFDTREAFLREGFRVLRPGGRLAVIDMMPLETDGRVLTGGLRGAIQRWSAQVPSANVYGATEYRRILQACGFADIVIESIREHVFPGYLAFLQRLLADPAASRRLHPLIRRGMRHAGDHFADSDYVLVTAAKPSRAA